MRSPRPRCPECRALLEEPNAEKKYFCPSPVTKCNVQFVRFKANAHEWVPQKVVRTGLSVLNAWWMK